MKRIIESLDLMYNSFFEELGIDTRTGLTKDSSKRFATKAAIGNNYNNAKKKILFISLDMGKDELFVEQGIDTYQNYEERSDSVCDENLTNKNPHMAGVYGTALYFLKDEYCWQREWELLAESNLFFREAIIKNHKTLPNSVLSHIALINFYSFVTKGRNERLGNTDRKFIDGQKELQLISDTINILKPDVVVVQSPTIRNYFQNIIKPKLTYKSEIYCGFHPSILGKNIKYRNPKLYIEHLLEYGMV